MGDPVRLGLVGLGAWGTVLADAAERSRTVSIRRCHARSPERRAAFAQRFGCEPAEQIEDLLAGEIDGVVIATSHSSHLPLIVAATEAGKHVLVEKPLTLSTRDAGAAITAAAAAGVVLQVGHQRRRLAATRELRRLVASGALGIPHLFQATITSTFSRPEDAWQSRPRERPLGGMTGLGIHMIDNLQALAGPASRVSTFSRPVAGPGPIHEVSTFLIEYESGALGQLANTTISPRVATVAAFGTGGCAWSEDDGRSLYRQDLDEPDRRPVPVRQVDALVEEFDEFSACVRSGTRPEVDGRVAAENVAVLEAGVRSTERGAAVELDELRAELGDDRLR